MIVRILNEGQWHLTDDAVRGLNSFDDAVEQAVAVRRSRSADESSARAAGPDPDNGDPVAG